DEPGDILAATARLDGAVYSRKPRTTTMMPCARPNVRKVCSYPALLIMAAIGMTVSAEPAPNPAAVSPAASPRRPGNHFTALPIHVPYTAPAPMPPSTAAK